MYYNMIYNKVGTFCKKCKLCYLFMKQYIFLVFFLKRQFWQIKKMLSKYLPRKIYVRPVQMLDLLLYYFR